MKIEPQWTSYVAIVTGIIGALTGIAGSLMGYIAYRRSNEIKNSDRRLTLHRLRNDSHFAATKLLDLLPKALKLRQLELNRRGMFQSGAMIRYTEEHARDSKRVAELSEQVPPEDVNYDSMSLRQLEQQVVRLDRIKREIDELICMYRDSIRIDEQQRGASPRDTR